MKKTWPNFIKELIQMMRKERPDLVKDDQTLLLSTDKENYMTLLLIQYRNIGGQLGYNLRPIQAKKQLQKEIKNGRITFGIVNSTKDGVITPWYAVHVNE